MSRPDQRTISGRRRDLRGVCGPDRLRALTVAGPGIESLEGIERMRALKALYLERVRDPDLGLLAGLSTLRIVGIDRPSGRVSWRALERLTGVMLLRIVVPDAVAAAEVAAVDFGALERLRGLVLMTDTPVAIDVSWAPRLASLTRLVLQGFFVPEGAEGPLCELEGVRSLGITTLSPTQYARLYEALPGVEVFRPFFEREGLAPLGVVFEPEPGVTDRFSVAFDLAETWDLETNSEAEALLRRELRRRAPALLARLGFDSESRTVWLDAPQREDLETVRAMIDVIAAERRR